MFRVFSLLVISIIISGCGIFNDFADDPMASSDAPPSLILQLDTAIEMQLGTYCWTSASAGLCVDMMPPIYEAADHISISDNQLSLEFAYTPPTSISSYVHPGSNLMTRIADIQVESMLNDDGTITLTLPEQLNGDYVLVVTAYWEGSPSGDAMYTLPIRVEAQ